MADKTEVMIDSDSKERVAFDLMNKIDAFSSTKGDMKDKKYWLTLYRQCLKATKGSPLEKILAED